MFPSHDQIEADAYHRWQRRGGVHGGDQSDWYAAEQELLLTLNYRVVVRHRLDGVAAQSVGNRENPRCRFCERSAPQASFSAPRLVIPEFLGNQSLFSYEECDECHALFHTSMEGDLERFSRCFVDGREDRAVQPFVPLAAFKGLVKSAIALLPKSELPAFEATIEWICNPDHRLDSALFQDLQGVVSTHQTHTPFSWAALARRIEEDAPLPYMLFLIGTGRASFQIHLPLSSHDDDLDGRATVMPLALMPVIPSQWGDRISVVSMCSAERQSVAGAELARL
jgi:hypothetical protein